MSIDDIEYDLRIGRTKYYEWMAQGWMPRPFVREGGVTRWRTSEIDEYIDKFPDRAALEHEVDRRSRWTNQRA
jgi:predicted DNA-binding transcriptional regulator AlpA